MSLNLEPYVSSRRPDPRRQIAKADLRARYKDVSRMPLPPHNRKLCEALLALLDADEVEVALAIDIAATARQSGHAEELASLLYHFAKHCGLDRPTDEPTSPPEN